ncbi:hypothetical protein CCMA1212_003029 [Trichoderma ghanense]|uniref:Uncharacterized protein n=1 Tax=Trichoderma ghanense TaxID=65468 RepID=A0ABY2HCQ0_9HYPO
MESRAVDADTPRPPHRQGHAAVAAGAGWHRRRRLAVLSLLSGLASSCSSGFCWAPVQAVRSEAGIAGIAGMATESGEMCAAALDAEDSALLARLAIGGCVRWPMLEMRKPKHQVSLS